MRVIDVGKKSKIKRITALSYGSSRAGKTRFAGSWPRPLFLSDATESGWTTLENMDKGILFEAGRDPLVWAIENVTDMWKALGDAEPLLKRKEVETIVVDSLTFYSDRFINYITPNVKGDVRQVYGKLGEHLKQLCEQVHGLGCNVVWLCLAKDPGDDQPLGGPMLPGQNAAKFAASCDYLLYHRSYQPPNAQLQWEVRTRKWQSYQAGGRDEGRLPDPLAYPTQNEQGGEIWIPDCTYRTLAEALGIISEDVPVEPVNGSNGKNQTKLVAPATGPSVAQPGRTNPR